MELKRITIITGHYGSGKTNVSVNLAIRLATEGKPCTVVDLDIVNPYFRSADFKNLFAENNISLAVSKYANSNLDIPSLGFDIRGIISEKNRYVIIDVGGDDAGAMALGRYCGDLLPFYAKNELDMFYVINKYRYLTNTPEEAVILMREIEMASGLKCTGIINNSNLGSETVESDILRSLEYAATVAKETGLPIVSTAVKKEVAEGFKGDLDFMAVDVYVKGLF